MQSLTELNAFGNLAITYTDERPATVIFDRETTPDQLITVTTPSVTIIPNFNILEIINYQIANLRYELEIISPSAEFKNLSSIAFSNLPSYMNLTVVGKKYTVSGFRSINDWNLLKNPIWTLPGAFNSYPAWYVRGKVFYYDQAQAQEITRDWDIWDPRFYLTSKIQSSSVIAIVANARYRSTATTSSNFSLSAIAESAFYSIVTNFSVSCAAGVIKRPGLISMPASTSLAMIASPIVQDYSVLSSANNLIFYNTSANYSSFSFATSSNRSISDVDWDTTGYKIAFTEFTSGQPSSPGALKILNRVNNTVSVLTEVNYNHIVRSVSWNPVYEYVAVGSGNSFSTNSKRIRPDIFKFQNNTLTAIQIPDLPDDGRTEQYQSFVRWSPDGQYLAVVNFPGVSALGTYPGKVYLYKRTGTDIFSIVGTPITLSNAINEIRWSPDSQYLVICFNLIASIYRKESNDSFTPITNLFQSFEAKRGVSWNKEGNNIAVGADTLKIWNQTGVTFTEITGFAGVEGNASPVMYSNITNKLMVGHSSGSRLTFYTYSNGSYTKVTNSYTVPAAQPTRISWRKAV